MSARLPLVLSTIVMTTVAATPVAAVQATWVQVPSPNSPGSNELQAAAGADPSHVWAVGRVVGNSTYRSLILRWNGSAWSADPHPGFSGNHRLRGVAAAAATDAWAVGDRLVSTGGLATLVEHWDGTRWSVVSSPNPNPRGLNELAGVDAVPGTVWAVGSYSKPNANFGTLSLAMRRSIAGPATWQVQPIGVVTPEDHLEAIDVTGANSAWAVGWGSTSPFGGAAVAITLRWDGTKWVSVPIPQPTQHMLFGVAALAANDVWAVGHMYPGGPHWIPVILHWNGTTWTRATIPAFPAGGQLRDIVALSPTNVYAVGLDGEGFNANSLVLHWDGRTWTKELTPGPGKLYGAAAITPSTIWAAGYRFDQRLNANQTFTIRTTNG